METPLKLEIQGFEASEHVRELISSSIAKFEKRFGGIVSCNIVIRAPGAHHREGEPIAVTIFMSLPNGREVSVGRKSEGLDRRHADISFAINDAFRRATRQLQDETRKLRGDVKQHVGTPTAQVASLEPERECGFLQAEDGRNIYFHAHSVLGGYFRQLKAGDRVSYHEEIGDKGPQASTVRLLRPTSKHRQTGKTT